MKFYNFYCFNFLTLFVLAFYCTTKGAPVFTGEISHSINHDTLTIFQDEQVVFQFLLNEKMIQAAKQNIKTKEKLGAYRFRVKNKTVFSMKEKPVITSSKNVVSVKGNLHSKNNTVSFHLIFALDSDALFRWKLWIDDTLLNHLSLTFLSAEDEHVFGGGVQYSHVDLKGHKVPVWVEEQGIGRGDAPITFFANFALAGGNRFTTYFPLPYFLCSSGKGILIENTTYSEMDFRKKTHTTLSTRSHVLDGVVFSGKTPKAITEKLTAHLGRMSELPEWAFGSWLGLQGGSEKVEAIVQDALDAGNPVSAVWIQDWVGRRNTKIGQRLYWNWIPDSVSYPGLKNFCTAMNEKNIRVLGYINPFLAEEGPLTEIAKSRGYLIKNKQGEDYLLPAGGFDAYQLDLTNASACEWIKSVIRENLIGNGFSGWMADFAEWLPLDAELYSGISPLVYHNQYPVDWARLNREAIREAGMEDEIIFFSRSGFTGSTREASLFWAGDQMTSWQKHDGLPSALAALLTSGFSGIAINHSDAGGYTSVKKFPVRYLRTRELLYRWLEMNAFTPVLRTHEGLLPKHNFQFYSDNAAHTFFARIANIHLSLKPYLQHLQKEVTALGYPMVRHTYFNFPDDAVAAKQHRQFMLGDDLIIFPVLKKKQKQVSGYLPEGDWQYLWSGMTTDGKRFVKSDAPLGKPAVWIRNDSKLLMELKQYISAD